MEGREEGRELEGGDRKEGKGGEGEEGAGQVPEKGTPEQGDQGGGRKGNHQNQQKQVARPAKPHSIYQSIPIPSDRVGWIIGKRGAFIQQIEKRSGCSIVISDAPMKEFGREWNYVQLSGTARSVDKAKKLLFLRLDSFQEQDARPMPAQQQQQQQQPAEGGNHQEVLKQ
ncbi:KH domain-containing protein [Chloropicon primus]|uniref:K Homology domain-containing protein n=1 Tax=Chloropicon primus TaxID=1764295 RepID=A0A5B8MDD8_9CHLO|nr:hypothetical protein A3770_01p06720 [Chloropicon primus]UPQ97366.1 KH domain-containing protein [Chloropicon primus]|eukprot:QDZ18154.1 hypothetical protein A3770_01p06720 [Chloropicon primus]